MGFEAPKKNAPLEERDALAGTGERGLLSKKALVLVALCGSPAAAVGWLAEPVEAPLLARARAASCCDGKRYLVSCAKDSSNGPRPASRPPYGLGSGVSGRPSNSSQLRRLRVDEADETSPALLPHDGASDDPKPPAQRA